MSERRRFAGRLTIGGATGTRGTYAHVELQDEDSRAVVVSIEVDENAWGRIMLGRSYEPCTFELIAPDKVGLIHQNKTEVIWVPDGVLKRATLPDGNSDYSSGEPLLKPFEVDGWRGSTGDLFNHHKIVQRSKRPCEPGAHYSVGFHRYVDPK